MRGRAVYTTEVREAKLLALADESMESWKTVVEVNQTGAFLGMRAVLPGIERLQN